MEPQIRVLNEEDAGDLFKLRRGALLESPSAFLASPNDDLASSDDAVRALLKRGPESVVLGVGTAALIGMLGLHRHTQTTKAAHKATLWGMFVLPQWRRRGLGARLLAAAIGYARGLEGVATVQLSVNESATAARHLYETAGFTVWGVEPDAMRIHGRSEREHHMALSLELRP